MAGCNMAKICRSKWKYDLKLKADLIKYVKERMQRIEILDFVQKDYPIYKWSLRTLDRRLSYFNIKYIDENVRIDDVREAVREELEGPGKLLGYRAMTQKIRQKHDMKVPRDLVHNVMYDLDAEGLEARAPGAKKRKPKGHFITLGPDWTYSVDGHDKLMGFQNSTFPLAIYGCIDTASRKLLWLKIWTTNSNPILVGKWYIQDYSKVEFCQITYAWIKALKQLQCAQSMHSFEASMKTLKTQQTLYYLDLHHQIRFVFFSFSQFITVK